jgi:integrase
MAHVEDRWYKAVEGSDGRRRRVKTELFGKGLRYRVRYIAPDGRERSKSFPDRAKRDADAFLVSIEADKFRGDYIDPGAGRVAFDVYAERWLRNSQIDESTRETTGARLRNHLLPFFGSRQLKSIKPEDIREWDQWMTGRYSRGTRAVTYAALHTILNAAVDDKKIAANPCDAKSVTAPKPAPRKIVPWKPERVHAVRAALSLRYRAFVDVGAGCGARQGEIFGIGLDDLDFDGGWLHIRRQVKRVRSRLVFGLPKSDKERMVPLPGSVARALKAHLEMFAAVPVTLPWENPDSTTLVTVPLVFTNANGGATHRCTFEQAHW